jgi:spermidine/putrescine ABC transporter ATP-binding subunit
MSTLNCIGISKSYTGNRVLNDVSAKIESGELLTLLGPSGCGKTTLLRAVAGLAETDTGQILLNDADVTHTPIHRRKIGMVFQSHALFPHMSVLENVGFGLRMQGMPPAERRKAVNDALSLVRLNGLERRMPHELSGGQQQRVAIARAIASRPSVLLLDEPFGALDRKLREMLQVELRQLVKGLSITSIFVTHDQEEALVLSDRIAVMNGGVIQQIGSPAEVFEQPSNRFVADFMGVENIMPAKIVSRSGGMVTLKCGGVEIHAPSAESLADPAVYIGIRSERMAIEDADDAVLASVNGTSGTVTQANYRGDRWVYNVASGMGPLTVKGTSLGKSYVEGQRVLITWEAKSVSVLNQ